MQRIGGAPKQKEEVLPTGLDKGDWNSAEEKREKHKRNVRGRARKPKAVEWEGKTKPNV